MKFIADEGVDAPIVSALRKRGYDVLYILEFSPGAADDVILKRIKYPKQNTIDTR